MCESKAQKILTEIEFARGLTSCLGSSWNASTRRTRSGARMYSMRVAVMLLLAGLPGAVSFSSSGPASCLLRKAHAHAGISPMRSSGALLGREQAASSRWHMQVGKFAPIRGKAVTKSVVVPVGPLHSLFPVSVCHSHIPSVSLSVCTSLWMRGRREYKTFSVVQCAHESDDTGGRGGVLPNRCGLRPDFELGEQERNAESAGVIAPFSQNSCTALHCTHHPATRQKLSVWMQLFTD